MIERLVHYALVAYVAAVVATSVAFVVLFSVHLIRSLT